MILQNSHYHFIQNLEYTCSMIILLHKSFMFNSHVSQCVDGRRLKSLLVCFFYFIKEQIYCVIMPDCPPLVTFEPVVMTFGIASIVAETIQLLYILYEYNHCRNVVTLFIDLMWVLFKTRQIYTRHCIQWIIILNFSFFVPCNDFCYNSSLNAEHQCVCHCLSTLLVSKYCCYLWLTPLIVHLSC
jgi:hypothetical protein